MTDKIRELVERRIENIFPSKEEVIKRLSQEKGLKIYYGIDPTGPHIHLGHTIQLLVLKDLFEMGHKPILLMGDFTARIGDPTGKDVSRKALSEEEVKKNMETYLSQVYKIIPKHSFEVQYNSRWLKKLFFADVVKLASHTTVQQMIARDMFQERIKHNRPIGIHEFLYPLMQGYDSVAMKVDGEVGGNDQTFNMLVGRNLEREYLGKDKLVLATRLLVDAITGKKMSKSEGELIALTDSPQEIRRKVLMVDDKMIKTIFELCTEKPIEWIKQNQAMNPREWKEELADELVRMYHGEKAVKEAHKPRRVPGGTTVTTTMVIAGLVPSISRAKELIDQGAVELNGEAVTEWHSSNKKGDIIKVGKGIEIEIEEVIEK